MRLVRLLTVAAVVSQVAFLCTTAVASAQHVECGGAHIVIEGGEPSPFVLPENAGGTLEVAPDSVLHIHAEGLPSGSIVRWGVRGLGDLFPTSTDEVGAGSAEIDVADYSSYARGLYELEGTLFAAQDEVCTVSFQVHVTGFGGIGPVASAIAAGVLGAGALSTIPLTARGMSAKLKLKVQAQRRRRRGWRRFIPVPAWKRTLTSTLTGAVSGLCVAAALQQGGFVPLSLPAAIWSMIAGGGLTFGVGYSLGALVTFLRPPEEPSS
jgi:hypothetical protein